MENRGSGFINNSNLRDIMHTVAGFLQSMFTALCHISAKMLCIIHMKIDIYGHFKGV